MLGAWTMTGEADARIDADLREADAATTIPPHSAHTADSRSGTGLTDPTRTAWPRFAPKSGAYVTGSPTKPIGDGRVYGN